MAEIPCTVGLDIVDRIYDAYSNEEKAGKSQIYLGRLGSSYIGNECIREVWFDWRAFEREELALEEFAKKLGLVYNKRTRHKGEPFYWKE